MVTPEAVLRKAKQQETEEKAALKASDLLKCYKDMLIIRRFEERAGQLYGMGLIGGFCHLYIGQEAVVVGIQSCLNRDDQVITTYRDHGHMIAVGTDPKHIYAELLGRSTGVSRGKGGSMHMFDLERHFYGGHGIVGAPVPLGTGLAFANKYKGTAQVCVTYFGDGSANQGQVYEAFNMAALWKLPVLYIIENNKYAMGTSVERSSAVTEFFRRGEGFGIQGMEVDGMNFFEVRKATLEALDHIRSGKGPMILEMKTYRYRGHSMSDPAKYRTKEEVEEMREKHDPIEQMKAELLSRKWTKEETFKKIEDDVKQQILEAVEFAKASPEPDASELFTDIYTEL
jgi:pyruvate dehydrogenase E1 component alpha subunit